MEGIYMSKFQANFHLSILELAEIAVGIFLTLGNLVPLCRCIAGYMVSTCRMDCISDCFSKSILHLKQWTHRNCVRTFSFSVSDDQTPSIWRCFSGMVMFVHGIKGWSEWCTWRCRHISLAERWGHDSCKLPLHSGYVTLSMHTTQGNIWTRGRCIPFPWRTITKNKSFEISHIIFIFEMLRRFEVKIYNMLM